MDAARHDEIREMFLGMAGEFSSDVGMDPRLVYRIMIEAGHRGLATCVVLSDALPRLPDNGTTAPPFVEIGGS